MRNGEYNGYSNYATWVVNLWINNSSWICTLFSRLNRHYLADAIREYVESNNPLNYSPSMYSDLLNAMISEVNFDEIAETFDETEPD